MNKRITKLFVMLLVIGMFGLFAYSLLHKVKTTDVGDKAYNFELENLQGKQVKLSDYKGTITVLNYFATWCKPCQDEAPELQAFDKDYGQKYKIVFIDRGETKDHVKAYVEKNKSVSTYLFDYNAKVSKIYNVTGQPETFVIDKTGTIREHYNGPLTEMELYNMVKKYD